VGGKRCHTLDESQCIIPQFGSGPFTNSSGSGHFSVAEYRDLLSFAKKHFITVVPEIDMPGHSHSAVASMEHRFQKYKASNMTAANEYRLVDQNDTSFYKSIQNWRDNAINPCIESTYNFISKLMDTLKDLHKDIQPVIYHFGGDEMSPDAWKASPACDVFLANHPEFNISHGNTFHKYETKRMYI